MDPSGGEIILCITGSRECFPLTYVAFAMTLDNLLTNKCPGRVVTRLLNGNALGVDQLAVRWAKDRKIKLNLYLPEAPKASRGASNTQRFLDRDAKMVDDSIVVVGFWNGHSKGTRYTLDKARSKGNFLACVTFDDLGNLTTLFE
jgi:hypothetical protein